jgi:hypothetical protein
MLLAIIMRKYFTAAGLFILSIPLIVGGIGLSLNDMDLVGLSILLIFIIYPITIIVAKKFNANR